MMKYNSRIGGVRKNIKERGHCTDDKCPCCEKIEDTDHIFICKNQAIEDKYISITILNYNLSVSELNLDYYKGIFDCE